ncbi:histidine-type phosphatase [Dysgonomonas sp. UBA7698]|uniref:histidine-type phosphatase n=1 Tax=Dysgonomonas sp. UBA7698 TaxID=1946427 RepID=UPI0025C71C12|nr:histidine-type phosphatase [Dysgonomonas sp. UBA7698]
MSRIKIFTILFLLSSFGIVSAQTAKDEIFNTIEKAGGIYYAYPDNQIKQHTPALKGYKAFYVSHFGRHGSRYLSKDSEYKDILNIFEKASENKALTSLGENILLWLRDVWAEAEERGGDLSALGVQQHRDIAERMYKSYPEVFTGSSIHITARSTPVVRCTLSMDAFCERLKELNPELKISRDASVRHNRCLNYHTKEAVSFRYSPDTWGEEYNKFEADHVKPERFVSTLFSDKDYVIKRINLKSLMWGLYYIAVGMQNIETRHSFLELFEKQELFDLWQCCNYRQYVTYANYALNNGVMMDNAKPLLQDMITLADNAIKEGRNGADLRFGHDGNIIPLAMLMHLENCYESVSEPTEFYKAWANFRITPMAGNIQIIFFRKTGSDGILVKFLLHENEVLLPGLNSDIQPYYDWKDVKKYYALNKEVSGL